jgi:TRAP-type transport system small permease protein
VEIAEDAVGPRASAWPVERLLVRANEAVVVAMAAVMVVLVVVNVFCRYVLNFSLVWAEEVSQYLMVWVAFLGAGLALRQGRHVAVEMLQELLPVGGRRGLRWLLLLAMLAFLVATAVLGGMFAWFARDMETPVLNISMAIPYSAVPIGSALLAIHLAFIARDYVAGRHELAESIEAPVNEGEI